MNRNDATNEDQQAGPPAKSDSPLRWPFYVRALAVAYVLSFAVQPIGFVLLCGAAAFCYSRRREIDGLVIGLGLGGVACAVLCGVYRWWFPRWGRKHWPPTDTDVIRDDEAQRPGA